MADHRKFWAMLKCQPGYIPEYKDELKKALVYQFSDGKTVSLSEFADKYPRRYSAMIEHMRKESNNSPYELDSERKRLIACVGGYFEFAGYYAPGGRYELLDREQRTLKIRATCARATGKAFNAMSKKDIAKTYSEFLNKQNK